MFTCFLFDFDGTLFDTRDANIAAYSQAFNSVGLAFDKKKYYEAFGLRFQEMMNIVAPEADEHTQQKIKEAKAQAYLENLSLVKPNSELINLLKAVKPNFKTALVTTASLVNVNNVLKFHNIDTGLFDVMITGENVQHGKPNKECYKKAINALNVDPSHCIVFEDSDIGFEAAKAAGAQVIRVEL